MIFACSGDAVLYEKSMAYSVSTWQQLQGKP